MINKQKLWFLTLFSLILVLSVYYVAMPTKIDNVNTKDENSKVVVNIKEESDLSVRKRLYKEIENKEIEKLRKQISNIESSTLDKNEAYDKIKNIKYIISKENKLEQIIKKNYKVDSLVKIENNYIEIIVKCEKHDYTFANNIMRDIEKEFKNNVHVSVKFQ